MAMQKKSKHLAYLVGHTKQTKTMTFTEKQIQQLSEPILAKNVKERDGNRAGTFQLAYVEGWHVIDEANRIFVYGGWSSETIETTMVNAQPDNVTYIAKVRITVGNVIREGTGAGHGNTKQGIGVNIESAIKEAETDARKRAFMQFGNQFGLSLYNGKDKSWKTNKAQINTGEVIETLREQVQQVSNTPDTDKTFGLAKNAILNAKSKEQLTDHQKNIATRFAQGKLTITQKEQLETLIVNKIKVLK